MNYLKQLGPLDELNQTLQSNVHPYPTQAEAIRKLGDQNNRTKLTPLVKSLFNKWLRGTR